MIDLTPLFNALITLIAAAVTAFLIPWLRSRTTAAQREELLAWAAIAVRAAEQLYTGSGRGEEKKRYVLTFLAEHGYTLDTASLDALIESTVQQLGEGVRG